MSIRALALRAAAALRTDLGERALDAPFVEGDAPVGELALEGRGRGLGKLALRVEDALADLLGGEQPHDLSRFVERAVPAHREIGRARSRALELELVELALHVAGAGRLLEDEEGREAWILPGRGPREVAERLHGFVTVDRVDPVARLPAAGEGEDRVRGGVEGVEREAKGLV